MIIVYKAFEEIHKWSMRRRTLLLYSHKMPLVDSSAQRHAKEMNMIGGMLEKRGGAPPSPLEFGEVSNQ